MRKRLILLLMAGVLSAGRGSAGPATFSEYQVKAAFLYNFIKFIEWPEESFISTRQPITVVICGRDPFGDYLVDIIKRDSSQGRKIELVHASADRVPEQCQMVFVSTSERDHLAQIFMTVRAKHIVTVSELEEFCEAGGAINIKVEENKIRFDVNPDVIENTGVKINSKLLRLARIMHTRPTEE